MTQEEKPDFGDWINSQSGIECMQWPISDQKYLKNRLFWAFDAGRDRVWDQLSRQKEQTASAQRIATDYYLELKELRELLSSKEQECRDLEEGAKQWKATAEWYQKENELLHKQYTELCNRNSDSDSTQDQPSEYKKSLIQQIMDLQKRCEDLEDENEKLEQYINEMTSNM